MTWFCTFCYGARDPDEKGNCPDCRLKLIDVKNPSVRSFNMKTGKELGK